MTGELVTGELVTGELVTDGPVAEPPGPGWAGSVGSVCTRRNHRDMGRG